MILFKYNFQNFLLQEVKNNAPLHDFIQIQHSELFGSRRKFIIIGAFFNAWWIFFQNDFRTNHLVAAVTLSDDDGRHHLENYFIIPILCSMSTPATCLPCETELVNNICVCHCLWLACDAKGVIIKIIHPVFNWLPFWTRT